MNEFLFSWLKKRTIREFSFIIGIVTKSYKKLEKQFTLIILILALL